jgi:hypothetical protein
MIDDFDIIALNGITGECLTTADDSTQRLKENPPDPLDEVRQEHEAFLTDLEAAAVKGLVDGNWDEVESCLFFYNPETKGYNT